jgi:hypothetical protein
MWALWLNRIGIVLNFLAGFMLAPELIGIERIRRFEQLILSRSKGTTNSLSKSIPRRFQVIP